MHRGDYQTPKGRSMLKAARKLDTTIDHDFAGKTKAIGSSAHKPGHLMVKDKNSPKKLGRKRVAKKAY